VGVLIQPAQESYQNSLAVAMGGEEQELINKRRQLLQFEVR